MTFATVFAAASRTHGGPLGQLALVFTGIAVFTIVLYLVRRYLVRATFHAA
jgi:hypothetical protein